MAVEIKLGVILTLFLLTFALRVAFGRRSAATIRPRRRRWLPPTGAEIIPFPGSHKDDQRVSR